MKWKTSFGTALALVAAALGASTMAGDPQTSHRQPNMLPGLWRTTILSEAENGEPIPRQYLMSIRSCDLKVSDTSPLQDCHEVVKRDAAGRLVRDETCVHPDGLSTHDVTIYFSATHTQTQHEDSLDTGDGHPAKGTAVSEDTYEGPCPPQMKDGQMLSDDGRAVGWADLFAGALFGVPPSATTGRKASDQITSQVPNDAPKGAATGRVRGW
jgi:hypothetical protein